MMIKAESETMRMQEMVEKTRVVLDEAKASDVTHIINVGTNLTESDESIQLAQLFDQVYATVGIHPHDVTDAWMKDVQSLKRLIKNSSREKVVAVGECGIDRHYAGYNLQRQNDLFCAQIELALEHGLALIVHSRDAYDETLKVIERYVSNGLRAVVHCFSYDLPCAQQLAAWDLLVGIGGPVTYPKNNELRRVVQVLDLKHIVLETDAPFLSPQIVRGKQNHPKYIKVIAEYVAQLRGQTYDAIAHATTSNAARLFKLAL